jgi:hypothetical protein
MTKAKAGELVKELFQAGASFTVSEGALDDWTITVHSQVDPAKLSAAAIKHGLNVHAAGSVFS